MNMPYGKILICLSLFSIFVDSHNCELKYRFAKVCHIFENSPACVPIRTQSCRKLKTLSYQQRCPFWICPVSFNGLLTFIKLFLMLLQYKKNIFTFNISQRGHKATLFIITLFLTLFVCLGLDKNKKLRGLSFEYLDVNYNFLFLFFRSPKTTAIFLLNHLRIKKS